MTDQERIADLERRMAELELRCEARLQAVQDAMTATQGVSIDALAMVALRDRGVVEHLLRVRRLDHQKHGGEVHSAEVLKRYELALQIADLMLTARPLGPK